MCSFSPSLCTVRFEAVREKRPSGEGLPHFRGSRMSLGSQGYKLIEAFQKVGCNFLVTDPVALCTCRGTMSAVIVHCAQEAQGPVRCEMEWGRRTSTGPSAAQIILFHLPARLPPALNQAW